MSYFKNYTLKDSIICDFHNTLKIELCQDRTMLHIKDCSIVCAFNVVSTDCNIYHEDAVAVEFSSAPTEETIEYIKSEIKPLILSNISGPNSFVVDIYGRRYFSL